jgi:hypothetical protein
MTKQERNRIHKACELVEINDEPFSCIALEYGFGDTGRYGPRPPQMEALVERYGKFYEQCYSRIWPLADKDTEEGRNERIMLMLFFAEAERDAKVDEPNDEA